MLPEVEVLLASDIATKNGIVSCVLAKGHPPDGPGDVRWMRGIIEHPRPRVKLALTRRRRARSTRTLN